MVGKTFSTHAFAAERTIPMVIMPNMLHTILFYYRMDIRRLYAHEGSHTHTNIHIF